MPTIFEHITEIKLCKSIYTACFEEITTYAEHQVATEGRRMEWFIRGLKTNIRELVSTRNLSTFQEAIGAAQEVEKVIYKHLDALYQTPQNYDKSLFMVSNSICI